MKFDAVNEALTLDRFTFIARFCVKMTRRKADRELVSGMQVREVRGGFVWGFVDFMRHKAPVSAEALFEQARRSPLNYYVQQAEHLRIEAHEADAKQN